MKIFLLFLCGAFSSRVSRSAEIIDCPGRCWEKSGDKCVPMADKIQLECSVVGHVSVIVDSCLFTPDNADYNQNYTVFFDIFARATHCGQQIITQNDSLEFNMSFMEAESCGWEWGYDSSGQITFSSHLRPSININKVIVQGQTLTISAFPDQINVQCVYNNRVTVMAGFDADLSNVTQSVNLTEQATLDAGFSVDLYAGNQPMNAFTVGQAITAKFYYDYATAGYLNEMMPFGFFAETCYIENQLNGAQKLFLVGSEDGSYGTTCLMDNTVIDLHVTDEYTSTGNNSVVETWSPSQYDLRFDTFKFADTQELRIVCNFQVCLKDNCPLLSTQETCRGVCMTLEERNTTCISSDTNYINLELTEEECGNACADNCDCSHFVHYPDRTPQECYNLKDCISTVSVIGANVFRNCGANPTCN